MDDLFGIGFLAYCDEQDEEDLDEQEDSGETV